MGCLCFLLNARERREAFPRDEIRLSQPHMKSAEMEEDENFNEVELKEEIPPNQMLFKSSDDPYFVINNWAVMKKATGCKLLVTCIAALILTATVITFVFTVFSPKPIALDPFHLKDKYDADAKKIVQESFERKEHLFNLIAELSDDYPGRSTGSKVLNDAIDWLEDTMKKEGLQNVRKQDVMVPHWVRGEESLELMEPVSRKMQMIGLGGSVGTPEGGISGEVFVINSFDDLEKHKDSIKDKIVLYNVEFKNLNNEMFHQYSKLFRYRSKGAVEAAKFGAIAVLLRSLTPVSLQTPHTGIMQYDEDTLKIPAAAITPEDSMYIQRQLDKGSIVKVLLKMSAQVLESTNSYNVIGEIVGTEYPDEIVVVGGHIDSWDNTPGAMDDGGGVIASLSIPSILRKLKLTPRRTIRVVAWVDEETTGAGSVKYAQSIVNATTHVMALESDAGVFAPTSITVRAESKVFSFLKSIGNVLLNGLGAEEQGVQVVHGGGGADTEPLEHLGVMVGELLSADSKYFWYHHTAADTVDKLNPEEIAQCTAVLAVFSYVVADYEQNIRNMDGYFASKVK